MSTLSSVTDGQLCDDEGAPTCAPKVVVQNTTAQTVVTPIPTNVKVQSGSATVVALQQPVRTVVAGAQAPQVSVNSQVQGQVSVGQQGPQGPAGDVGPAGPPGASAGQPVTASYTSGHPTTLYHGTPVCVVGGALRLATAAPAFAGVVGLVYEPEIVAGAAGRVQIAGTMVMTIPEWEVVTGMVGGLAPEQTYYLTQTGAMTPYPPTLEGFYVAPVGYAISATEFLIETSTQILL